MTAFAYDVLANVVAVIGIAAAIGCVWLLAVIVGRVAAERDRHVR